MVSKPRELEDLSLLVSIITSNFDTGGEKHVFTEKGIFDIRKL